MSNNRAANDFFGAIVFSKCSEALQVVFIFMCSKAHTLTIGTLLRLQASQTMLHI